MPCRLDDVDANRRRRDRAARASAGFCVTKTVRDTLERPGTKMSVVVRVVIELIEDGEAPRRLRGHEPERLAGQRVVAHEHDERALQVAEHLVVRRCAGQPRQSLRARCRRSGSSCRSCRRRRGRALDADLGRIGDAAGRQVETSSVRQRAPVAAGAMRGCRGRAPRDVDVGPRAHVAVVGPGEQQQRHPRRRAERRLHDGLVVGHPRRLSRSPGPAAGTAAWRCRCSRRRRGRCRAAPSGG